jgi:F5/8 type C domain-containing protein/cellulase (glycosyl hydrolase family 5)
MKHMRTLPCLVLLLGLLGCNLGPKPGTAQPAASPTTSTSVETPAAADVTQSPDLPQHRIAIRVVDGSGEFYDRLTGQKFTPRGNNFARLAPQLLPDGGTQVYHSVFDPGQYDPQEIAAQFAAMRSQGYNVVRVFVSQNTIGTLSGGLSPVYMANVAGFLRLAKASDLYVIFTQDWLPGGRYGELIGQTCCELFNFNNAQNLPSGAVNAYRAYYADFIRTLAELDAPTDQILSYELRNEFYFDSNYPPLSLGSGMVTTANGETYDMASSEDRARMLEENLPFWIDTVREAILTEDPTALVSVGFFVPQEPYPARIGDTRVVVSAPAIWNSQADFIDLHAYPGFELNLKQHVENFGVDGMLEKPIIMGEFGANVHAFASAGAAARALLSWQVESCQYGFDGWLLWTWDLPEQYEFYNALSGNGEIDQALSPASRPDACQPGADAEINLALGKAASASSALAGAPAANAIDGNNGTVWNAGAGPTQWIEIDLGEPERVIALRLIVAQSPSGTTKHQVYVRGHEGDLQLVHTFEGPTTDGDLLEFIPDVPPEGAQFVRIVTVESPSWVAWKEIEVLGE